MGRGGIEGKTSIDLVTSFSVFSSWTMFQLNADSCGQNR